MKPDTVDLDSKPTRDDVFAAKVEVRGERPVLVPLDPQAWLKCLGRIVGQFVTVRIERPKRRRTHQQNAYYWACVLPDVLSGLREIAVDANAECPFADVDELHEAMKYLVLGNDVIVLSDGSKLERPSTTTTLTTAQFANYIDTIIRWSGERGIPVRAAGEEVVA